MSPPQTQMAPVGAGAGALADRARPRSAGRLRRTIARHSTSWLVIAVLLALVGLPSVYVVLDAIAKNPLDLGAGFSFSALKSVYTSSAVLNALWQTVLVSLAAGALATVVGGSIAWMLTRFRLKHGALAETLVVVPLFLSPLVGTIAWQALAAPRSGILNDLLNRAGAPGWLRLNIDSVGGIVFVLGVNYVPYAFLFISGVLRNMDSSLEEASYMCGESMLSTARRILAPLVRSGLLSSLMFITILAAGEFSVPSILAAGTGYQPLSVQVYNAIYGFPQNYPEAGSISTMMIVISLVAMFFYRRATRDSRRFVTVGGRGLGSRQAGNGGLGVALKGLLGVYVFVAIVLPYASLLVIMLSKYPTGDITDIHFTTANITSVLSSSDVQSAILNTVELSLAVPIVCLVLGLIVVYCTDRIRMPGGGAANYLATVPIAISGIVFGTGALIAYIRTPIYGTIWLIAVALIAHYLAHAVRIIGNGFSQIDTSLEEAARMNGASSAKVLRTIGAPLLRPSLVSAFMLIYVFAVREVNATIILYSPTSLVLSVLAWNYLSDGTFASAAVVGAIQTLLMLTGLLAARVIFSVRASQSMAS